MKLSTRFRLSFLPVVLVPLVLASCGGGDDETSTGGAPDDTENETVASPTDAPMPPTSTIEKGDPASGTPPVESLYVEVDLENDAPLDASTVVGAPVTIIVTSDIEHEFHLHGYDVELTGTTVKFEFVADRAGEFELETHDTGELVLTLQVFAE